MSARSPIATSVETEIKDHLADASDSYKCEEWNDAIGAYRAALELLTSNQTNWDADPRIWKAQLQLARCYYGNSDIRKAMELCNEIIRHTSKDEVKGTALVQRSKFELALKQWETAHLTLSEADPLIQRCKLLDLPRDVQYNLYYRHGLSYLQMDEEKYYKEAENMLESALLYAVKKKDNVMIQRKLQSLRIRFKQRKQNVSIKESKMDDKAIHPKVTTISSNQKTATAKKPATSNKTQTNPIHYQASNTPANDQKFSTKEQLLSILARLKGLTIDVEQMYQQLYPTDLMQSSRPSSNDGSNTCGTTPQNSTLTSPSFGPSSSSASVAIASLNMNSNLATSDSIVGIGSLSADIPNQSLHE